MNEVTIDGIEYVIVKKAEYQRIMNGSRRYSDSLSQQIELLRQKKCDYERKNKDAGPEWMPPARNL